MRQISPVTAGTATFGRTKSAAVTWEKKIATTSLPNRTDRLLPAMAVLTAETGPASDGVQRKFLANWRWPPVTEKEYETFRHYDKLMRQKPGHGGHPSSCKQCEYYQPRWKYRTCMFSRCLYQKECRIFRNKPLEQDKHKRPEMVVMDDV